MKSTIHNNEVVKNKEKISLKKFKTIDALKTEIRNKIAKKKHAEISSNGSFISISFDKNGI
jgi:hypothetical protein